MAMAVEGPSVALSGQRAQPGAAVHEEVWLRFPPPFLLGEFEKCKMLLGDEEKEAVSLLF